MCSLSSDLLSGHADMCVCVLCLATCSQVMQAGVCVCSLSSDLLSGHAGRCVCVLCLVTCSLSSDLLSGHAGRCVCVPYLATCSWVMQAGVCFLCLATCSRVMQVGVCVFPVQRPALGSCRRVCVCSLSMTCSRVMPARG